MCCNALQCATVFCSVLQCVAVCCSVLPCVQITSVLSITGFSCSLQLLGFLLQFGFCSVLPCIAVCCSVLRCFAVCCGVLRCVAVCCSCVALSCCSVLQFVADNTLQHNCNTTVTHLQHSCNTLHHTLHRPTTPCNTTHRRLPTHHCSTRP